MPICLHESGEKFVLPLLSLLLLNMEKLPKAWKEPRGNDEMNTLSEADMTN